MKTYHLNNWQYWYDRGHQTWYAAKFDKEGNQQGDAVFAFNKEDIKSYCV